MASGNDTDYSSHGNGNDDDNDTSDDDNDDDRKENANNATEKPGMSIVGASAQI